MAEQSLRHVLKRASAPTAGQKWGCPDESVLAAFADGQMGDSERVESHLADCNHCRQQVAFLVHRPEPVGEVDVPAKLLARAEALGARGRARAVSPAWRWATAAAVTACLVLVITLRMREQELGVAPAPPAAPVVDSTPPEAASPTLQDQANPLRGQRSVRGEEAGLSLPTLLQPLDSTQISGELRFRWRPVNGSLFYEIRVTTAAGDPVWQSERIHLTAGQLPTSIRLTAGEKYFVWVVAYLPEGKTVRSSAVAFTVRD